MSSPSARGVNNDKCSNFTKPRLDTVRGTSIEDHGFRGAVRRDLKSAAPGFRKRTAQQGIDINHSVEGAENREVKLKPTQEREALASTDGRQEFGTHCARSCSICLAAQLVSP